MSVITDELRDLLGVNRIVRLERPKGMSIYRAVFADGSVWPVYQVGRALSFRINPPGDGQGVLRIYLRPRRRRVYDRPTFGVLPDQTPRRTVVTYEPSIIWWVGPAGRGLGIGDLEFPAIEAALTYALEACMAWVQAPDRAEYRRQTYRDDLDWFDRAEAFMDGFCGPSRLLPEKPGGAA